MLYNEDSNLNYYGLYKMIYNVSYNWTHSVQSGGAQIASINYNGLYIGFHLLSSTVLGYVNA